MSNLKQSSPSLTHCSDDSAGVNNSSFNQKSIPSCEQADGYAVLLQFYEGVHNYLI